MKDNIKQFAILAAVASAITVAATGCSHNPPPPSPAAVQQQTQQNIQQVQNDPNLPADTKANLAAHFQNPAGPPTMAPPKSQ